MLIRHTNWVHYAASLAGAGTIWLGLANRDALRDLSPGSDLQQQLNGAPWLEQVPSSTRFSYTSRIADPDLVPYRAVLNREGAANAKTLVEGASAGLLYWANDLLHDPRWQGSFGLTMAVNGMTLLADLGWWMPSNYTYAALENDWNTDGVVREGSMVMPSTAGAFPLGDVNHVGQTSNPQFISAVEAYVRESAQFMPPPPDPPPGDPPPPEEPPPGEPPPCVPSPPLVECPLSAPAPPLEPVLTTSRSVPRLASAP